MRRLRCANAITLALLAAVAVASSGCITRTLRNTVFENASMRIVLRSQSKGGNPIERGYEHPAAIAPVRMAHILSRIDVRTEVKKGAQRSPAIPTEMLYSLADQLVKAFAEADSSQEIVVFSIRRTKRFGVFDRRYLTSFVTYMSNDQLYVHLSRTDWEIPKSGKTERLPEPRVGDYVMKFRVVPSKGMTQVDGQSVAVDWRDPVFKKPTRTRVTPSGKVIRRTILMESPEEETAAPGEEPEYRRLPENLSSDTLRALADLEDQRHRGEISEAEYERLRRQTIRADPATK
jgi:hypothetical protein